MSDFDTEVEATEDEEASLATLQKKIAALEKDNKKLRDERRKAEFVGKYGEEIAAEVADLPDDIREAWAEKLLKLQPKQEPEVDESAPEPETPTVEVPAGLAAVANAPAAGAPEAQKMTPDEFRQHVEQDGLVVAAQKYGHMVVFPDIDNPLVTGQATQIQGEYRPPS